MVLRRILIVVISFAIIFACYLFYTIVFSVSVENGISRNKPVAINPRLLRPTTLPVERPATINRPEEVILISPGEKAYFERYSKGRLLYQFRADKWEPTDKPGTFDLVKPEIRIFLKRGQIINISADKGTLVTKRIGGTKIEPIYGKLIGRVHIFIDRSTETNRSAPELRPEDIIHIWLNNVTFNLELNTIESNSTITVESFDAEMFGKGLVIKWDDIANEIEVLKIIKGDKLIIYRGAEITQIRVPGEEEEKKGRVEVTENKQVRELASQPTTKQVSVSKRKRRKRSYVLSFASAVKIRQYEKAALIGTMTCDRLNVIFDIPKRYRRELRGESKQEERQLKTKPTTYPAGGIGKPSRKKAKSRETGPRLEITWEGPLEIRPIKLPYSPLDRFQIVAYGRPIEVNQIGRGKAFCKKLVYKQELDHLILEGTTSEPVKITQGKNRRIVGVRLSYDRKNSIARGVGPGFMEQVGKEEEREEGEAEPIPVSAKGRSAKIFWQQGVELRFGKYLKFTEKGRYYAQYLKYAKFTGGVEMLSSVESIKGEIIEIRFKKPEFTSKPAESIDTLYAEGNVALRSDNQSVSCNKINVKFQMGRTRVIPKEVTANGDVVVKDGKREITSHNLYAIFGEKIKQNGKSTIALREFRAKGKVLIQDPFEKVNIKCEGINAKISKEDELVYCELVGLPNNWAEAKLRDFTISSIKIITNPAIEEANVSAPGRLIFWNKEDIDGRKLKKPIPIEVSWSGFMKLTGGKKNQGIFTGDVKVVSDRATLYADRLMLDFEDKPIQAESKQKVKKQAIKVQLRKKKLTYIEALPKEGRLIYVQNIERREGKLINRVTLRGKSLIIDLVSRRLNVPEKGDLVIEDYRLPRTGASSGGYEVTNPLGADIKLSSPSQTVFTWQTGLLYLIDKRIAIFDGAVRMIHLSGPAVLGEILKREDLQVKGPARRIELSCENLKVEFIKGAFGGISEQNENVGISELEKVVATGAVHLAESTRSIIASKLFYDRMENIVVIEGKRTEPAYLYEESSDNLVTYSGPLIVWDRTTGQIRAPGASIMTEVK